LTTFLSRMSTCKSQHKCIFSLVYVTMLCALYRKLIQGGPSLSPATDSSSVGGSTLPPSPVTPAPATPAKAVVTDGSSESAAKPKRPSFLDGITSRNTGAADESESPAKQKRPSFLDGITSRNSGEESAAGASPSKAKRPSFLDSIANPTKPPAEQMSGTPTTISSAPAKAVPAEKPASKYAGQALNQSLRDRMLSDGLSEQEVAMHFISCRPARTYADIPADEERATVHVKPVDMRTTCKSRMWTYLDEFDLASVTDAAGIPICDKIHQKFSEKRVAKRRVEASTLDGKRATNITTVYTKISRQLKLQNEQELFGLLMGLKYKDAQDINRWLTSEMVKAFQGMMPFPEEYLKIFSIIEDDNEAGLSLAEKAARIEKLDRPCKVVWYLGGVKRATERLKVLDISHSWRSATNDVNQTAKLIQSGVNQIKLMEPQFKQFCSVALAVANFLNAGRSNASAKALSLRDMVSAKVCIVPGLLYLTVLTASAYSMLQEKGGYHHL
jgi:hypothetical protein